MFPRTALSDITSLSMCLMCCCYSLYLFKLAWFEIDLVDVIADFFLFYFFQWSFTFYKSPFVMQQLQRQFPCSNLVRGLSISLKDIQMQDSELNSVILQSYIILL